MKRTKGGWAAGLLMVALGCSGMKVLGEAAGGSDGAGGSLAVGGTVSVGGTASGGASVSGSVMPSNVCETACVRQVFGGGVVSCKLCHGIQLTMSGLNLDSPNFTARLKDVPARHADLGMGMTTADCPIGDKLIDSANPEASWLLRKLRGQQGNCGTSMPQTPPLLMGDNLTCIETYVYCVAGSQTDPKVP